MSAPPPVPADPRRLRIALVAPSRYDARGVAVFRFGLSPNGALGALAGLVEDYNRRHDGASRVDYEFFDEHVREPVDARLLRRWDAEARAEGARFVLFLCGVQTVTWPRARDLALLARREGIRVVAGGVHLSAHAPSVDFLVSCGVPVAIGEVEPLWDDLLEDLLEDRPREIYRIDSSQGMTVKSATSTITVPDIARTPFPHIPREARRRYVNPGQVFLDTSRGCPFLCTFCVVKNVFGRTVRAREPKDVAAWIDCVDEFVEFFMGELKPIARRFGFETVASRFACIFRAQRGVDISHVRFFFVVNRWSSPSAPSSQRRCVASSPRTSPLGACALCARTRRRSARVTSP